MKRLFLFIILLSLSLGPISACKKSKENKDSGSGNNGNTNTMTPPPPQNNGNNPGQGNAPFPTEPLPQSPEWEDYWAGLVQAPGLPNAYPYNSPPVEKNGNSQYFILEGCHSDVIDNPQGYDPSANPKLTIKSTNNKKFIYAARYYASYLLLDENGNYTVDELGLPTDLGGGSADFSGWSELAFVHELPLAINPSFPINLLLEVIDEDGNWWVGGCENIFQENTFPPLEISVTHGLESNGYDTETPTFTIESTNGYFFLEYYVDLAVSNNTYFLNICEYTFNNMEGARVTITLNPNCFETPDWVGSSCTPDNSDEWYCQDYRHKMGNSLHVRYFDQWMRMGELEIPNFYLKE